MQSVNSVVAEPSTGRWGKEEYRKELAVGMESPPLKASHWRDLRLVPREFSFGKQDVTSAVFVVVL